MLRLPGMKSQGDPCKRLELEEGDHNPARLQAAGQAAHTSQERSYAGCRHISGGVFGGLSCLLGRLYRWKQSKGFGPLKASLIVFSEH